MSAVAGQLNAPIALPLGTELRYPLNRGLGGPQRPSGHFGEQKNQLPLPTIEPLIIQAVAKSVYWLCLPICALHNATCLVWPYHQVWIKTCSLCSIWAKQWNYVSLEFQKNYTYKRKKCIILVQDIPVVCKSQSNIPDRCQVFILVLPHVFITLQFDCASHFIFTFLIFTFPFFNYFAIPLGPL
jgi:hypothetical protein